MIADARYEVLGMLGQGGMATVYLVHNVRTGSKEALKVLNPQFSDSPRVIGRFRREARVISRLHHRNIIGIHEFGRLADGALYLTTEYAEGESVASTLTKAGPLPIDVAVGLLLQLLAALDHAHGRGVIHRDLKPGNLLVVVDDGEQVLKVIDFGVAKIAAADYADSMGETGSREIFGTPSYMAPEQFSGGAHDPRIDLYAVGCIAFDLMVGRPPFEGPLPMLLHQHLDTVAPRLRERRPDVPEQLDAALARCLEKEPDKRFQSAAELAQVLERIPSYQGVKYFDEAWKTQIAGAQHELDPIDIDASSDALVHAAAEALLAHAHDPALERALATISTLELSLDAIEAEMIALEHDSQATDDEMESASLTDRAISLAARKAEQEDAISQQIAALRQIVDRVASQTEDRLVHGLLARERGLRILRRI